MLLTCSPVSYEETFHPCYEFCVLRKAAQHRLHNYLGCKGHLIDQKVSQGTHVSLAESARPKDYIG